MGRKSRAKRCAEACSVLSELVSTLRGIEENLPEDPDEEGISESEQKKREAETQKAINEAKDAMGGFDFSELEDLLSEIESWKDNMESANMTHLPKFGEVEECFETLSIAVESLNCVDNDIEHADDIGRIAGEIEDAVNEAESVSFPGMF